MKSGRIIKILFLIINVFSSISICTKIHSFTTSNCKSVATYSGPLNKISLDNCKTDITFAIDSSSDSLLPILFNDYEISLIKDNITSNWTDFSNVNLAWYADSPKTLFTIGTMNKKSEFDFDLSLITQSSGSNLGRLIDNLNLLDITPGNSLSTYIFIAQYNDNNQQDILTSLQNLKQNGNVNFIILGNVVEIKDLQPLQPSNIFYWDFDPLCIPMVTQFFQNSLSCNN
uniref:VWFA domain-containing protein n=1 Tax=Parastrongyloides trichosuri TaxID=131310 RepID=A0A0N4Z4E1_PARTI